MERVLVCLLASTRSHQVTFPSFKQQVLDELNADLAVALAIDETYDCANPFWQHAKYRWTAPLFADYGEGYDLVQRWLCEERKIPAPDWRIMLRIKGHWQGGIASPDPNPRKTAAALLPYCRWILLQGLRQSGALDRYDRFVITRSDFIWLCPHPPLSVLDRDALWIPDLEHWGGLNDRHLVASRDDIVNCLNALEDILLHPAELYQHLKDRVRKVTSKDHSGMNDERLLWYHFARKGILHKRKFFPYVMYLARALSDKSPTWTPGLFYEPRPSGHFVKYDTEFRSAKALATIIHSRADWEKGQWKQFIDWAVPPQAPMSLRLGDLCRCLYHERTLFLRRGQRVRLARYIRLCLP